MQQLIIVTGLSGSGKTIALQVMEDSGYYCVDNLPATLLTQLVTHLKHTEPCERVAISIDSRSVSVEVLPACLASLRALHVVAQVLFLDANTETLVKRFSETRRKHPLSKTHSTLIESITHERRLLENLRVGAYIVDTSQISASMLKRWVKDILMLAPSALTLVFVSFGFKHGLPLDADMVFDARCLPNPYYDLHLRPLTGQDQAVQAFMRQHAEVTDMQQDIQHYIAKWLSFFITDNRSYLTIAIGCTGGHHRSVYLVDALAQHFSKQNNVLIRHRELNEEHS